MKPSALVIVALTLTIAACSKVTEQDVKNAPPSPAPPGTPVFVPPPPSRAAAEDFAKSHPPAPAQPPPTGMPIEVKPSPSTNTLNIEAGKALAQKSGCFRCHDKEFKRLIIGPPWGAVAEKYRGRPEARDILIKWVHTGGSGRWGTSKMPPYSPQVPDADIEKLVDFILSLPSPS